tara:strand:+ start:2042 stop:2770 length:729 start_codon:yes stop_codon:yes gene_type:complete
MSGGSGNLASHIVRANKKYRIHHPPRASMDVTQYKEVEEWIDLVKPDVFIHSGAFTRPMSKHQIYPIESISSNIVGTSNVAMACINSGVKLVYISTDYVYPGTDGEYKETDALSPFEGNSDGVTKYGWSKLGGECAVRICDNSLIIRACICNFPFPHPRAAIDIRKSLMFDEDAAPIILRLLDETGVINVGGEARSVYDFVSETNPSIGKISSKEILDVKIAPDTSMDITKLKKALGRKIDD